MQLAKTSELAPWLRHLLVGLIERQLLANDVRDQLLKVRADAADEGDVPGRPSWSYRRDGRCWSVSHREARHHFTFSPDSDVLTFETLEVAGWLITSSKLDPLPDPTNLAFRRAYRWLPGYGLVCHALEELHVCGGVSSVGGDRYQLGRYVQRNLRGVSDKALEALRESNPGTDEQQVNEWRAWLALCAADPAYGALRDAHAELGDAEVERLVLEFLRLPPGEPMCVALEVADARGITVPAQLVQQLLETIDVLDDESGETVCSLAKHALSRGIAHRLAVQRLVEFANRQTYRAAGGAQGLADVAELLLVYSPDDSLVAIRRALREDGLKRLIMGTKLIAIGQPWAIREIEAALPDINPMMANLLISALRDRGLHEAADRAAELPVHPVGFMAEMMEDLLSASQSVLRDGTVTANLDEWVEHIRAGLSADFDPRT